MACCSKLEVDHKFHIYILVHYPSVRVFVAVLVRAQHFGHVISKFLAKVVLENHLYISARNWRLVLKNELCQFPVARCVVLDISMNRQQFVDQAEP